MKPEGSAFGLPITLGDHDYRIVAQRHARLRRELAKLFNGVTDMESLEVESADSFLDLIEERVYDLLAIFIPDLMPRYEFEGYATNEAMEADRYDEQGDKSPTQPEIKDAIAAGISINGFDWIDKLKNFIGSDFLRAQARVKLAEWANGPLTTNTPARSLPSLNGESASTPITPREPIQEPRKTSASLSPD